MHSDVLRFRAGAGAFEEFDQPELIAAVGQAEVEGVPFRGARMFSWGRFMGLVFRMGLGGDFGAEPPQSEGSGGKAFCGTKRFLWHKNTPCRAPE